ncbi:1,2-dihydroxy-3-keto-5-methylthiopentene dioxygenase [Streptomyces sp. NPDC101178]|uniref:1,2-dihydroxy-3-keto-5-methylthiopentene dioxygenase n=1 Tax=Streptomyces sp. NPDC101178 TaxID=3366124 RepID=UPI00380418AC
MTLLQIMPESAPETVVLRTEDIDVISAELAGVGVRIERWHTDARLPADADDHAVMEAYRRPVDRVIAEGGYRLVDIVRMVPDPADPAWPERARAAREKFLEEHFHDEDEVRFFAAGSGCFYLHVEGRVYATVCTAGDLLSVPRGTVHWFDMGSRPHFTAIRFFQEEDGWIGRFLPDSIAARFPGLDELMAPV